MRRHWVPLLTSEDPAQQFDFRKPPSTFDAFTEALASHSGQIKLAVYSAPFIATTLIFYNLWTTAETERRIKERIATNAAFSASDFIYKTFGNAAGQIEMQPTFKQALLTEARSTLNELNGIAASTETIRLRGVAAVLIEQSALDTASGRSVEGKVSATEAVEILRQLYSSSSDPDVLFDLATAHDRLGVAHAKNDEYEAAIEAFGEGTKLLRTLVRSSAPNEKLLKNIAASEENLSLMHAANRSLNDAVEAITAARKVRMDLTAMYPGRPDLQIDLARCSLERGQLLLTRGDLVEAKKEQDDVVVAAKGLPASIDLWLLLANVHQRIGEVEEKLRDKAPLLPSSNEEAHFREAFAILRKITEVQSDRPDIVSSFAGSTINLGFMLGHSGRAQEALSLYRDSLPYVGAVKDDHEIARLQARLHAALGDVKRDIGDLDAAHSEYRIAVDLLETLKRAGLGNSLWRADLLVAYRRAADIAFKLCDIPQSANCKKTEAWDLTERKTSLLGSTASKSTADREA